MRFTVLRRVFGIVVMILAVFGVVFAQDEAPPEAPEATPDPMLIEVQEPAPVDSITVEGVTLDLFFSDIPQGRVALVRVFGERVVGGRALFLDELTEFFEAEGQYYGLLAVNMDQNPRVYELSVFAWLDDGSRVTIPVQVEVVLGGFVRQDDLGVTPDRAFLIDPQVERNEMASLFSVFDTVTEERLWADDGFQLPISSEITSPFGAFRTFNQNFVTRHTGWDLRAPTGTPVMAMASGRVAFAGLMDIRGNHVIIDHGYGIFSGYSHLSQVHVTRGQSVTRGQIIGVSGNTGRSSGAHLHWEIAVNGEWVDSVDFLRMWLP